MQQGQSEGYRRTHMVLLYGEAIFCLRKVLSIFEESVFFILIFFFKTQIKNGGEG